MTVDITYPYKNCGLTAERVRDLLMYDPFTGLLRWKVSRGCILKGSIAGCVNVSNGYVYIGVDGHIYLAHCIIWLHQTGNWPSYELDHRDLKHSNNIWENLREANPVQNCANRPMRSDSNNLYKGITQRGKKWRASIVIDGRRQRLGTFTTAEEAHNAYMIAAVQKHGTFARAK